MHRDAGRATKLKQSIAQVLLAAIFADSRKRLGNVCRLRVYYY